MQDLRRVLLGQEQPEVDPEWLGEELPHLGNRPDFGYMNTFEWSGANWVPRKPDPSDESYTCPRADLDAAPAAWFGAEVTADGWRKALLAALAPRDSPPATEELGPLLKKLEGEAHANYGDGLNTGFYINAYTTKHCPTMEGVLDEMRKGFERLEQTREEARARYEEDVQARAASAAQGLTCSADAAVPKPRKTAFGESLEVLKRLNASYRRCYWKSGSEMLFPIFYGHLTFASHRCWTVFVKKGVYLAAEAWRREHGRAVRHAAIRDGGGEILQYNRAGMDPWVAVGWKKVVPEEGGAPLYEGPNGELFEVLAQVYEYEVATKHADAGADGGQVAHERAPEVLERLLQRAGGAN